MTIDDAVANKMLADSLIKICHLTKRFDTWSTTKVFS